MENFWRGVRQSTGLKLVWLKKKIVEARKNMSRAKDGIRKPSREGRKLYRSRGRGGLF